MKYLPLYGCVPLNKVTWFSRFESFNDTQWCTIFKNRVSFWTGSLSKSVKTCDERSIFAGAIPIIFFVNIYLHDFSVKKYLILYAKQNKSGSKSSVSCLKQGGEMNNFCLKQSRGLKASATHLYPNFPWVPSPPGKMILEDKYNHGYKL